ncbi:hypothetical protein BJ322DRAFT_1105075 [Thelephora terrestris]|uniref:Uncharacterized protein n=1 Tax=Thelephora terrestris TaxID=56493 RepID=A0A9P6L9B7_9AGAM|nr:hypothetical protein BJ322DRAFT_1105075 [Thelephora terrestris]
MITPPSENNPRELTLQERKEIHEKARWLRRIANPFVDFYVIASISAAGSSVATVTARGPQDRITRDHTNGLTPIQRKIYTEDFEMILGHLPFLKNRLESNDSSKSIQKIINKVQSVASQARQSDTKSIKQSIVALIPQKYLPLDENGNALANAYQVVSVKNPGALKSWRGWESLITARLLCPIDHLAEFKIDPDGARAKLRDGKLSILDIKGDPKFPTFLYDDETTDGGSLADGLFCGPILLAVYTHIFILPSAATGAKASLKRGNAKIHGMEKVVPSTICYAAIQAYVALCCSREWKEEWKGVKFARLYFLLREQLAYPEDPWCADTLQWWNDQIFGESPGTDDDVPAATRDMQGLSICECIANERQQRIQAVAGN